MHPATTIKLPFGVSERYITAGSFKNYPGTHFYGLKLAPEVPVLANCVVQVPDFGLPEVEATYSALRILLYRIAMGQKVYLGCMGGYGRTGTFLALIYRCLGVEDPITYVRKVYCGHAVETRKQEDFVMGLPLDPIRYDILRAKYTAALVDRHNRSKGGNGQGASEKKRDRKAEKSRRKAKLRANGRINFDWDAGPEPRWLPSERSAHSALS